MIRNSNPVLGVAAAAWALVGWSATLAFAMVRLGVSAVEALSGDLDPLQLAALLANAAVFAWAEGYRGFQKRFSPRAAARVLYLRRHSGAGMAVLAPFFCIGFLRVTPRIRRMTWLGTGLIVLAIIAVRQLPQPWRGIVDLGVVIGLAWGLVTFVAMSARALATGTYPVPPEVPEQAAPQGLGL
jgi:hypothetical protein